MVPITGAILDAIPDPVLLLNRTRTVVDANRAARDLLDVDLVGHDLARSLRHPDALTAVDAVLTGEIKRSCEIAVPGAVARTFLAHAVRLAEPAQDGVQAILVLAETTAIQRAEQMRADFVANASHELRSPLSAVLGFIETMRGPAAADEHAKQRFLDIMHKEGKRMARLVDDLLSLSRIEINEHVRPRGHVDIATVLAGVCESLGVKAAERRMTIQMELAPGLPAVIGDGDQLTQVFHNLVENALRYGREATPVTLSAQIVPRMPETGGAGVGVAVRDQGDGIPQEAIPRLTERFYRVDKARSQSLGGTGLGLAIVKHIVNRHRGRLRVESKLGEGSTFTVFLPAYKEDTVPDS